MDGNRTKEAILADIARSYRDQIHSWHDATNDGMRGEEPIPASYVEAARADALASGAAHGIGAEEVLAVIGHEYPVR